MGPGYIRRPRALRIHVTEHVRWRASRAGARGRCLPARTLRGASMPLVGPETERPHRQDGVTPFDLPLLPRQRRTGPFGPARRRARACRDDGDRSPAASRSRRAGSLGTRSRRRGEAAGADRSDDLFVRNPRALGLLVVRRKGGDEAFETLGRERSAAGASVDHRDTPLARTMVREERAGHSPIRRASGVSPLRLPTRPRRHQWSAGTFGGDYVVPVCTVTEDGDISEREARSRTVTRLPVSARIAPELVARRRNARRSKRRPSHRR